MFGAEREKFRKAFFCLLTFFKLLNSRCRAVEKGGRFFLVGSTMISSY